MTGTEGQMNIMFCFFVMLLFSICFKMLVIDKRHNLSSSLGEGFYSSYIKRSGMLNGKFDLDPSKGSNCGVAQILLDP